MKRWLLLVIYLGLLLALTGCVTMRPERTEPTGIAVVKVPTASASVVKAAIYVEGGRLVVTGNLRRAHEVRLSGHVDISVCGPEGVLERKSVKVPGLSSKRNGVMSLPFTAHLNLVPPPGSEVTIRYHAPPFIEKEARGCV